jgi:penicillin-binding protein 1A
MSSPKPRPSRRRDIVVRVARSPLVVALVFVLTAAAGAASGVLFAYAEDVGEIGAVLDNYQPNTVTQLLARGGEPVGTFAVEQRLVVDYEDIAPVLRNAIIATEDGAFEQHFGLNPTRLAVAVARGLLPGQPMTGASTITQQVARLLFLQDEYMSSGVFARRGFRGVERKVKEWLLALQLERRYTKREILTFYANQSNLGLGIYGVEAAAQAYFGKPARDLTLSEAASIAATFQTPARLDPTINPDLNRARRNNVVLARMLDEGFITEDEAAAAAAEPVTVRGLGRAPALAPYFAEGIRQELQATYGADVLYQGGLRVQTTLDATLQRAANAAVDAGLRRADKLWNGWRRPARNVLEEDGGLDGFRPARWSAPLAEGDIVPALVMAVPEGAGAVDVRIGEMDVPLAPAGFSWTRRSRPSDLMAPGDVVEVRIDALDDTGRPSGLTLEQSPALQGALVAIENATGRILAMVGGASFGESEFNRATQARRQMGSLFKPIVYTAAIDRGFTPTSIFIDEPVSIEVGPNQPPYEPQNYDREYEGPITLRRALEDSRNIPAVKAMQEVGPETVIDYAVRFGFPNTYPPFLSLALGAAEATLLEVTSAYSAFPNRGVRMEPYSVVTIADREGVVLEERGPQPREAVRADTAFVMTTLMRGVVQRGTGAAALSLNWPVGGKTGTMDEYTDAWFVGFDPDISVGVWVGRDDNKPIGNNATGAAAALPIWNDFMRVWVDAQRDRPTPPGFEPPANIVFVRTEPGIIDAFISGTQPTAAPAGLE